MINAKEARKITDEILSNKRLQTLLSQVQEGIKSAAHEGKGYLDFRIVWTDKSRERLVEALRSEGYRAIATFNKIHIEW